ncbi:MAG: nucleotide exchange factor GrpE [Acidimicrobiales bacterium]|nr:nucleotide exchange factor GrpE [Acidimicrobiales bacterium]
MSDDTTAGAAADEPPVPATEPPLPDDDELLEAAAIAEENPAAVLDGDTEAELLADDEVVVDGGRGGSDLAAERDEFREAFMRVKADFENYKKRSAKEHAERVARAAEQLVTELLPVLDGCDAAIAQGASDVEPIARSLLDVLEKSGLERLDPVGAPFDPELHEAVLHEPGDGGEPVVVETMRTGYAWKGRVVRAAMVKVRD